MKNWQDVIIEGLVGLAVYLIGIRGIREVLRGVLRWRWGDLALQLLTFLLLLIAITFFQVPALSGLTIIGGVLAVLTITTLTTLLREYGTGDSDVALWFSESAPDLLRLLPGDRELNTRGLRRMTRAMRNYGHNRTVSMRSTVVLGERCASIPFLIYDYTKIMELEPWASASANIVIEVRPSLMPAGAATWTFPPIPLRSQGPEDKFRYPFWAPILPQFLGAWQSHLETVTVGGHLIHRDGAVTELEFVGNIRPLAVTVGIERFETHYAEFTTTIQLMPGRPLIWCFHAHNLIHPLDMPSMYFLANDICAGSWEFQIQSDLPGSFGIGGIAPITNLGDVAISHREIMGNSGRIRLEAAPDSLILPQDAVLFLFRQPTQ